MTNDPTTPRSGRSDGPAVTRTGIEQGRRDRRRRTIYASLAGWTLLGAASTGIVACSSAQTGEPAAAAAATTQAASSSAAATSAAPSSGAPSSTAAASTEASSSAAASSAESSATSSAAPTTSAAAASTYKDGTYTATGSYQSPGGTESVTITLTIADDTITDASGEGAATRPPSSQYQGEFLDNFAGQIVGKNIDEVSLSKVAGSSLTSGGFNQALQTIKTDARA